MEKKRYCALFSVICLVLVFGLCACAAAQREPTYTVELNWNYRGYITTKVVPVNGLLEAPRLLERVGYEFVEWRITENGQERPWNFEKDVVTEDTVLTAVWVPIQYQLYLHPENGEETTVLMMQYGQPYDLPIPTKEGYEFYGWMWNQEWQPSSGDSWGFDRNMNFYAKWVNFEPGTTVTLGEYEQDNNQSNGAEPIEWIVLAKEDDKFLIVSKHILDYQQFHDTTQLVPWRERTLRLWLNETFYSTAFTEEEKRAISLTRLTDVSGEDYVFLLSYQECGYFISKEDRVGTPTAYAEAQGCVEEGYVGSVFTYPYWIRGSKYIVCRGVGAGGSGNGYKKEGVRPAMWVDVATLEEWGIVDTPQIK